jgi:hypothetical protein
MILFFVNSNISGAEDILRALPGWILSLLSEAECS